MKNAYLFLIYCKFSIVFLYCLILRHCLKFAKIVKMHKSSVPISFRMTYILCLIAFFFYQQLPINCSMFVIYIILYLMRLEYFYTPIAHGRPKWSHWSWPTKGSGGRCRLPSSSPTHLHLHPDSWTSGQGTGRAPGEAWMEAPGCPGITRYVTKRPP